MKIAKGSWQEGIWTALESGRVISNPVSMLRGKAKSYAGKYQRSFSELLDRAKKEGYTVAKIPGVRGGDSTARFMLLARP